MIYISLILFAALVGNAQYADEEVYEYEYEYEYEEDVLDYPLITDYLYKDSSFQEKYNGSDFDYDSEFQPNDEDKNRSSGSSDKNEIEKGKVERPMYRRSVQMDGFGKGLFQIILIIVIGALLFLLIRVIANFKVNRRDKAVNTPFTEHIDAEVPEDLEVGDLRSRLSEALKDKNFSLAVRYYFLLYLEKLERNRIIEYHVDKTNLDYLNSIADEKIADQFVRLSYLFEYVWYGKKAIDELRFAEIERIFNQNLNS